MKSVKYFSALTIMLVDTHRLRVSKQWAQGR